MDRKTELKLTIEHWEKILEACKNENYRALLDEGYVSDDCILCQNHRGCDGCPVREYTGHAACFKTPYDDFDGGLPDLEDWDDWELVTDAAERELVFLKMLLEKEE